MLNIFYGRESIDKEKFIFKNLGKRVLIMVPDQYTLEAERQAFRHLGISSLMDVEIVSANSLGNNVVNELGGSRRNFINKYGRHMLLYKSALAQKENLQVFKGMETRGSFLDSVNNFISEMKQYNCKADDLKEMAQTYSEDSYTQKKLMDVYRLFADYEKQIEGKYTDSEDYIDLYLEKINQSELVKDNEIWIYGFDSFAPKSMDLLEELMVTANDVNLVLTWDNMSRDRELFELTGMVMENAEKRAESKGVAHKRQKISAEFALENQPKAISHIEKELYTLPFFVASHQEGITLVEAAGIYNEAESAAAYVLKLVRDKGLRYKDIRLVCNDMENRGPIIERVFEEYGIEVFSDVKRDISSNPIIQFITSLLDVVIEKYSSRAILGTLKSGFGDLTNEELSELENYAIKYKIKGTMWKKPFKRGTHEYGEDGLEVIETLRKKAVEPIAPLEELFKIKNTGDFLKGFYGYLCNDLKVREKILDFIAVQEEKGLLEEADQTVRIWDNLWNVLNQIYEIMGQDQFEPKVFKDIFVTGISQIEIGLLPPTEDGLILGNIQRSRSSRAKALVVLGVNEGVLPQEKPTQGLFSAEERQLFRDDGKELCKVDSIRFMEEKLAIYRNLSSPTEYLWMSYSLSDEEGSQLKPSSIFLKMKELFPELEVEKDVVNQEDSTDLINSQVSGLRHLSRMLQNVGEGNPLEEEWGQALSFLELNHHERMEKIRRSISFTNNQEDLGKSASEALFKRDVDKAMSLSPSRIEKFSRCPFSHLIAYGLKPEERRVFEAAPREIGDIYHRCLMRLTRELTQEGVAVNEPTSPWMTVTEDQCKEIVEKELTFIAETYREGLFKSGNLETYRSQRASEICSQICWTVVEQVRSGQIDAIAPEISFGRKGSLDPIEVLVDDQKVYIEGIIDRVDYLPDDRVKIIDYKTGNESFDIEEASAGYRLQLMIYLQAACKEEKKPAGVFYFKIKEPIIDLSQKELEKADLERELRKAFKLDGIMVDEPQVIEGIAGQFEGFSEIIPVRLSKEGVKNTGKPGLLPEDEFAKLQETVAQKIQETCTDLLKGKIDVHPMKTKDRSACAYCQYKGICRFDTIFDGCKYNII